MRLRKTADGVVLEVYVKPNSKRFEIEFEGDKIVVSCREAPMKGKVNRELVKEFSRFFNRKVELVSGFTSRHKKIFISNIEAGEVNQILSSISAPGNQIYHSLDTRGLAKRKLFFNMKYY